MTLAFYVQHLLGIGHLRRAERLAHALVAHGFDVVVLSGGLPVAGEDWGGARVVRLPPVRAAGVDFKTLVDAHERPIDDAWRMARRDALLEAVAAARPAVLLLEGFPFARRQFRFELLPLLDRIAAQPVRPLVVTSIRDILVAKPDPARVAEVVATVLRAIDRVLVHGDPTLIRLDATFPGTAAIANKLCYTGFVAAPAPPSPPAATPRHGVVVSVGGGAVGAGLLMAACGARALSRVRTQPWRLLSGPMMPEPQVAAIRAAAPPGVTVERHRDDFRELLSQAVLSVSQAGYNTVLDLLQTGPRMVLVPFAAASETEQALRARLLADTGRAVVVDEATLTPERLAAAIDRALAAPSPPPLPIDGDGAAASARAIRGWLAERRA
jgi:predicted glycosyltransferase